MNFIAIKTIFCLIIMVTFLVMAFFTKDASNVQLFASFGIIMGALANKSLSGNSKSEK